ncbi:MAG: hypothetical protein JXB39_11260 [Deltaproteobacteria bacterium]|nr:hypothetical protein [Deltaproteobacteria bacterium]
MIRPLLVAALVVALFLPDPARAEVAVEATGLAMVQAGPATALGVRLQGDKGGFLALEGRTVFREGWMGRGTVGIDLFGGSDAFDVTFGAFLGSHGTLCEPVVVVSPTVGLEFGIGLGIGPVQGRYRHIRGGSDAGRGPYTFAENEWRLGFRLPADVTVYGQVMNTLHEHGQDVDRLGVGAGATVVF